MPQSRDELSIMPDFEIVENNPKMCIQKTGLEQTILLLGSQALYLQRELLVNTCRKLASGVLESEPELGSL
jgi:hypothetical protein